MKRPHPNSSSRNCGRLISWLAELGATGLENITIREGEGGGLGVFAAKKIAPQSTIYQCPTIAVAITADNALNDPIVGPPLRSLRSQMDKHEVVIVYLLYYWVNVGSTNNDPYVADLIAQSDELMASLPKFWPPKELELLGGTSSRVKLRAQGIYLREFHNRVVDKLTLEHPSIFPAAKFTIEALQRAHATYWSRAITVPTTSRNKPQLAMTPLFDLFNHANCPSSSGNRVSIVEGDDTKYKMVSASGIEIGEEIFINVSREPKLSEVERCGAMRCGAKRNETKQS